MPKSNKKSKSKSSTKQSQKQKQTIVVNVNSNNKRKSTHYHHKNSNNPPAHIVVPSTNHHMMFMPQPQGQPQPQLLGDNAYGIGQARLLDPVIQRMNETLQQVQQNALNNSIQQEAIHDAQEQRRYNRADWGERYRERSHSVRNEEELGAGWGERYASGKIRGRSQPARNDDDNWGERYAEQNAQPLQSDDTIYAQMQDINVTSLSSEQRSLLGDYLQRAQNQQNEEPFAIVDDEPGSIKVDQSAINYNYTSNSKPLSIDELTAGTFGGNIESVKFTTPKVLSQKLLRNTMMDYFDQQGEFVPKSLVKEALTDLGRASENKKDFIRLHTSGGRMRSMFDGPTSPKISMFDPPAKDNNTLEYHYSPPLAIEDTPSKTRSKIEEIIDEVKPIKIVEKTKEERDNMRRAQRLKQKEQEAQAKEIAEQQRIIREKEAQEQAIKAQQETADIRKQKNDEYNKAKKVEENISNSTKFENPTELITTFTTLQSSLLASENKEEMANIDELKNYNKLKTIIDSATNGKATVSKVGRIRKQLILDYLIKNEKTIKGLKQKQVTQTTVEPVGRYRANNITNATTLLTSTSEPQLLPPIRAAAGGGAIKLKKSDL